MTDELRAKLEAEFPALSKRQQPCTCVTTCVGSQSLGIGWICTAQRDSGRTYRLVADASGRAAAIQCYVCGLVSHHPKDVSEKVLRALPSLS
jgi:hypothetical protein